MRTPTAIRLALFVACALIVAGPGPATATILDLTSAGANGTIGSGFFLQVCDLDIGTGPMDPFLRIHADYVEEGVNSDGPYTMDESAGTFTLRYALKGASCAAASYATVTPSTAVAFYDNGGIADGANLNATGTDPTHGGDAIANQTYEEANNFSNSRSAIADGADGKWDFALVDYSAPPDATYCFTVVNSDGSPIYATTYYPEIALAPNTAPANVSLDLLDHADGDELFASTTRTWASGAPTSLRAG